MLRISILVLSFLFISFKSFSQTTIVLNPTKDNTIFSENGNYSNGTGGQLFIGRINGQDLRRALIQFNLSSIPSNAQIVSAKLEILVIQAARTQFLTVHNFALHKLTKNWGEGASLSFSGRGSTAQTNDATWQYNFFTSQSWTNPGGDFVSTATSTTSAKIGDWCTWNTGLINDINAWRTTPATNFGWIILGDENAVASAKVFNSRSSEDEQDRPKLTITYTIPTDDKILINEVNPNAKWVELYNPSSQVVNLNNYYVVNGVNTSALVGGSVNVLNGNLSLNPNEYVVLGWNAIGQTTGEIALYNNNPTGSGIMMDYVQYGAANQSKAAAAVTAQVWDLAENALSGLNNTSNTYSLNAALSYPNGGKSSNSTSWQVRKQSPTYQNVNCPNSLNLSNNVINAPYSSTGDINSTGSLLSTSNASFLSQKAIILSPNFKVDSGAVFEVKIENCN